MQAGKLRHLLTVEADTETRGPSGSVIHNPGSVVRVWGEITPLSGNESWATERPQADVTHRIRLRSGGLVTRELLTPQHRLRYGERKFEILSILDTSEVGAELIVQAKEVA